jgi:hypothetical protein
MIPVEIQPEPLNFSDRVKSPGERFLARTPKPSVQQWKGKEYWRRALPEMRRSYNGVCAYCAFWIPHSVGNHSIDHFIPKSQRPDLAYDWDNYRYVSARFNGRKGAHKIVDPFALLPGWFILDFRSFFIKPDPGLSKNQQRLLWDTIKRLKLNSDDDLVDERQTWHSHYTDKEITFGHLKKKAPFMAFEILRQGLLVETLPSKSPEQKNKKNS